MSVEIVALVIRVVLVVATAFLFAIVLASYLRLRNRKLLFISIGFGVFFVHALIYIPELFTTFVLSEDAHLLIHLVALIFIVVGILKD
jgi:hypothetical protein